MQCTGHCFLLSILGNEHDGGTRRWMCFNLYILSAVFVTATSRAVPVSHDYALLAPKPGTKYMQPSCATDIVRSGRVLSQGVPEVTGL